MSDVDAVNHRLLWINPKAAAQLSYDSVVSGFDAGRPILIESIEYTLLVRELGRLIRVYEGLSLVPEHRRYGPAILAAFKVPRVSGQPLNLPSAPEPVTITELRELPLSVLESMATTPDQIMPLTGGADGLAQLSPYDFIGEDIDPLDSDDVRARKARGLRTLEDVREIAIVAVPDIHIQPKAAPRFSPPPPCVPDPCLPLSVPPAGPARAVGGRSAAGLSGRRHLSGAVRVDSTLREAARSHRASGPAVQRGARRQARRRRGARLAAAASIPSTRLSTIRGCAWSIRCARPRRLMREIPPSGHVAGQYAQNDSQFGVHKAPANAPLIWAEDVTVFVDDAVHGILNPGGINAIRPLPGRGLRIFGARTMSSDTDWRYVNVRRLMMMIEKAIEAAIQWAVFEPNSILTRDQAQSDVDEFLAFVVAAGRADGAVGGGGFFRQMRRRQQSARGA